MSRPAGDYETSEIAISVPIFAETGRGRARWCAEGVWTVEEGRQRRDDEQGRRVNRWAGSRG